MSISNSSSSSINSGGGGSGGSISSYSIASHHHHQQQQQQHHANPHHHHHHLSRDLKKRFTKTFDLSQIAEDPMDSYLDTLGLWKKRIARDGSCLFRAVAEQVSYNYFNFMILFNTLEYNMILEYTYLSYQKWKKIKNFLLIIYCPFKNK